MKITSLFFFASLASSSTVYFIRHGEKPTDGDGLSQQGEARAQCLRTVFGITSAYNIGYIMAQTPQSGNNPPNVLVAWAKQVVSI